MTPGTDTYITIQLLRNEAINNEKWERAYAFRDVLNILEDRGAVNMQELDAFYARLQPILTEQAEQLALTALDPQEVEA